jgi:hypothetical protein
MKKVLLILLAVVGLAIIAHAQDVITLRNGKDINALVSVIWDTEIEYKRFDNPDGPLYTLKKSEILMIRYANGTKDIFSEETQYSPSTPHTNQRNDLKNEFYRIGSDDRQMVNFFRKNNFLSYYNDFESACRMRETGRGLLIGGLTLTSFGTVFMIVGLLPQAEAPWLAIVGYGFVSVGEVLVIVSIPGSAVAGAKKRAIKNDFARENFGIFSNVNQPILNFGYTGNGIGISLKF